VHTHYWRLSAGTKVDAVLPSTPNSRPQVLLGDGTRMAAKHGIVVATEGAAATQLLGQALPGRPSQVKGWYRALRCCWRGAGWFSFMTMQGFTQRACQAGLQLFSCIQWQPCSVYYHLHSLCKRLMRCLIVRLVSRWWQPPGGSKRGAPVWWSDNWIVCWFLLLLHCKSNCMLLDTRWSSTV